MHAIVIAVIFTAYVALMALLVGYLAGQVRNRGDGDGDGGAAVVDITPAAGHRTLRHAVPPQSGGVPGPPPQARIVLPRPWRTLSTGSPPGPCHAGTMTTVDAR